MENKMTDAEKEKFLADHQETLDQLVHVARVHFPHREEQRRIVAERFNELTGLPSSVLDRIEITTLVLQVQELERTVEEISGVLLRASEQINHLMEMLVQKNDITNVPLRAEQEKKEGTN